ncbi:MAG: PAS domain-containing protein [Planctomycetes bacterium]|nr:PAS domain-containing protein [Planctomycetota bacterium]
MSTRVVCAWCNLTIRPGDSGDDDSSHGICFDCVKALGLFPTEDVRRLTAEELDRLPIGVIELDRDGVVRRYNEAEARAAGLSKDQVVGHHFFDEVAPCTTVREFQGRFEEMRRSPNSCREELDFVFHFATGDRYAHLVFLWDPEAGRLMILADLMGSPSNHSARANAIWRDS